MHRYICVYVLMIAGFRACGGGRVKREAGGRKEEGKRVREAKGRKGRREEEA